MRETGRIVWSSKKYVKEKRGRGKEGVRKVRSSKKCW
jgi:hypothetical protein